MIQNITMRDEIFVQDEHVSLIEAKKVVDLKHFLSYPSCHRSYNDYFMYALRDNKEINFIDQLAEERSVDLICMLDDITHFDDLPKYDKYDDEYVVKSEAKSSSQSSTCFQHFKEDSQLTHVVYGSEEESVENLEVSEEYLPLCFTSFQFIRDNFHAIRNQQSLRFDLENQEDIEILD